MRVDETGGSELTDHECPNQDGLYREDQVGAVLLEHARWIGGDLAQRIDTMTQRAGVLLGASLTLMTLWIAVLLVVAAGSPQALLIGSIATLLAYGIPTTYSMYALATSTYHSVGSDSVARYLNQAGRPKADDWPDIHSQLLFDLVSVSQTGSRSVLAGMESDVELRNQRLKTAQASLAVATTIAPMAAMIAYVIRSTT